MAALLAAALAASGAAAAADPADNPIITLVKAKVQDPAKPFTLVVTLKIKPGQEAAAEAAYFEAFAGTKLEPGYLAYDLNRSADDPATYVLYERWKSVSALETHLKLPHTVKFVGLFGDLADGPPEVKVLRVPVAK